MQFAWFDIHHLNILELFRLNYASLLAFIGALCYVPSFYMKTIVPLRIAGIIGNAFFLAYGYFYPSYTTLFLYLFILPINIFRLYQMWGLIKQVRVATQGDLSMEWLKPFMTQRKYQKGDILFRKGDLANEMFYVLSGAYLITEIGVTTRSGQVLGELGFLSPDNRRTQTVECTEDGRMLTITYDKVRELYFQNPTFGFYFLRLTSERLMQNIARLEGTIAASRAAATSAAQ